MTRRTRSFLVLAVAVTTAALASAAVYRAVRQIPVREVEVAHQFVVLASRPAPLGARLTEADVKLVGWPSSSPLQGAFARIEDVVGRGVVAPLGENEPITDAKLAPLESGSGLAPAIPPGMRAISVKVNEVIGVAGFVVPGARVDVIATVRRPDDAHSRVVVGNVRVLTAGTRYDQEQETGGKPIPSTVVTLEVTPADAEKIALASAEGQITLMLRNPVDVAQPDTPGARLARLVDDPGAPAAALPVPTAGSRSLAGTRPAVVPAAAVAPVPSHDPGAYSVEAIRAGIRSRETVRSRETGK